MKTMTLDQERAKYAWERVEEAHHITDIGKYTNTVKSTASLIMGSGLMQTLAFLQAKGEKQHLCLLDHLCKWLGKSLGGTQVTSQDRFPPEQVADFQLVMTALYSCQSDLYIRANSEIMALMRWLRQFADAKKTLEK